MGRSSSGRECTARSIRGGADRGATDSTTRAIRVAPAQNAATGGPILPDRPPPSSAVHASSRPRPLTRVAGRAYPPAQGAAPPPPPPDAATPPSFEPRP